MKFSKWLSEKTIKGFKVGDKVEGIQGLDRGKQGTITKFERGKQYPKDTFIVFIKDDKGKESYTVHFDSFRWAALVFHRYPVLKCLNLFADKTTISDCYRRLISPRNQRRHWHENLLQIKERDSHPSIKPETQWGILSLFRCRLCLLLCRRGFL